MNTSMRRSAMLSTTVVVLSISAGANAVEKDDPKHVDQDRIDEIVVLGREVTLGEASISVHKEMLVDSALAIRQLPGADANLNGRLTGIAQYRGMYGDRVAVTIDDCSIVSGGPNAMDTPLSYLSPMIADDIVVERGIAGIDSAPESIGGHIGATISRGEFTTGSSPELSGSVGSRYAGNGNTSTSAGRITIANSSHKLSLAYEADRGSDIDTPAGTIVPSGLSRDRADVSYAWSGETTEALLFAGVLDTSDSGTPALAMDIRLIDTELFGGRLSTTFASGMTVSASAGFNDVRHEMDNFSVRTPPAAGGMYRQNLATGDGLSFDFSVDASTSIGSLRAGVDGQHANHESVITNPNNAMFEIQNFNGVSRDINGVYAVWSNDFESSDWEFGVRYNQVRTDAGDVGASGMMGPAGDAAAALASNFNGAARSRQFNNVDAVAKYRRELSGRLELRFDIGSKTRAPSYQEMYLWLPLQATGGLADGRNYVGNMELKTERSNEINAGVDWSTESFRITPQLFYKRVDNYIQGVPSTNMAANMLATMMSGKPALEFSNVDAEIYGVDFGWEYTISDSMYFDGSAAWSRGRRTDEQDNLYRLVPPNTRIAFNVAGQSWTASVDAMAYARQKYVSAYNDETETPGYGIFGARIVWTPFDSLRLEAGVDNLLDRAYQNHTAGVNRVAESGIPQGVRIYGPSRTLSAGVIFSF